MTPTHLDRYRPRRRQLTEWATREPDLAGLDFDALRAGQLDRTLPATVRQRRLAALVRLARDDPEALGVAVVCLQPGLAAVVRRHGGSLGEDAWPAAVAELCVVIRTHSAGDEPGWLAQRLLGATDSRLRTLRRQHDAWAARTTRLTDAAHGVAVATVDDPERSAAVLLDAAVGAGVLSAQAAGLIVHTRLVGLSLAAAADHLDISYEAAKKRRQRGEAALAAWLTADEPAAPDVPGAPVAGDAHGRPLRRAQERTPRPTTHVHDHHGESA